MIITIKVEDIKRIGGIIQLAHPNDKSIRISDEASIKIELPTLTLTNLQPLAKEIEDATDSVVADVVIESLVRNLTKLQLAALFK